MKTTTTCTPRKTRTAPTLQPALTFDDVWRKLQETEEKLHEMENKFRAMEKMLRETREPKKETSQVFRKTWAQVERSKKRYDKLFDFRPETEMVERLIWSSTLHKKFSAMGYKFSNFTPNYSISDAQDEPMMVDVFMGGSDYSLAINVKTKICVRDLKEHLKCMEAVRFYTDMRNYTNVPNEARKILGAVATSKMSKTARETAHQLGFFVIDVFEHAIRMTVPAGFKPREW